MPISFWNPHPHLLNMQKKHLFALCHHILPATRHPSIIINTPAPSCGSAKINDRAQGVGSPTETEAIAAETVIFK